MTSNLKKKKNNHWFPINTISSIGQSDRISCWKVSQCLYFSWKSVSVLLARIAKTEGAFCVSAHDSGQTGV